MPRSCPVDNFPDASGANKPLLLLATFRRETLPAGPSCAFASTQGGWATQKSAPRDREGTLGGGRLEAEGRRSRVRRGAALVLVQILVQRDGSGLPLDGLDGTADRVAA